MNILVPPATHNIAATLCVAFETHPPTIAPTNVSVNAIARLFRFRLVTGGQRKRSGSEKRSQRRLVITTVGISATSRARLVTICPADWKLSKAMGISCVQWIGSRGLNGTGPPITPPSIKPAANKIQTLWMKKERTRVPRRRGPNLRLRRESQKLPRIKQQIEVRERAQP